MQEKASDIILGKAGPGDTFTLKYGIFSFHLEIKPLTARQVIEIAGELSKISEIDPKSDMFVGLLQGSSDLNHLARAISIATGTRMRRLVQRAILKLPLKDISILMTIIKKQSDPEVFFYSIILAKGMNRLLTPKEQS